jgi:DNA-binding beta-propeller fold protein YncE
MSRLALLLAVALLSALPPGCARRAPSALESPERVVWPPPPAAPRIEYVQSFQVPADLGIRKAWIKRFFSYLAGGRRRLGMARPYAVAATGEGGIAVADPDARSVHLYDTAKRRYRRLVEAGNKPLASPVGVALDSQGRLYVSDSVHRTIFRFAPNGKWLDRIGTEGDLLRPTGLAIDGEAGRLYVVDTRAHAIVVYDLEGQLLRRIGRRGIGQVEFNYPVAIAVGPEGNLHVTDSLNFRVQVLDPSGRFLGAFGQAGTNPGDLDKAKGIAVDRDGHIYLIEALHDVIQVYDGSGRLLTVIGGTGTGPGQFWLPTGVCVDQEDRILVADSANHRVQILRYLGEPES